MATESRHQPIPDDDGRQLLTREMGGNQSQPIPDDNGRQLLAREMGGNQSQPIPDDVDRQLLAREMDGNQTLVTNHQTTSQSVQTQGLVNSLYKSWARHYNSLCCMN